MPLMSYTAYRLLCRVSDPAVSDGASELTCPKTYMEALLGFGPYNYSTLAQSIGDL